MATAFVCPTCGGTLKAGDEAVGKVVRCGGCRSTLRVPGASEEGNPPPEGSRSDEQTRPPSVEPIRPKDEPERLRFEDDLPRPRRRRRPQSPPPRKGRGPVFWILTTLACFVVMSVAVCGGVFHLLQPKWYTHHSEVGGFRVELPARARADMPELAQAKQHPNVHIEGTILFGRFEEYSVVYTDIDPPDRRFQPDEAILTEAVRGFQTDTPGTRVVRDTRVTVSGHPGREVVFTHASEGTWIARMVVANNRLYILIAGGVGMSTDGNTRVRRFLDSFVVTNHVAPPQNEPPEPDTTTDDALRKLDDALRSEQPPLIAPAPPPKPSMPVVPAPRFRRPEPED